MDATRFRQPADDCRGTDFWMLNDTLDEGELRRQLRAMRAQGVASVIARTYIGLKSDYPGPDFMGKMRVILDEARALNMTVFLQAGYMPEAVLDLPEAYSLGDVRPFPEGTGEGEVLCRHAGTDYCLRPSGTILDMLSPEASRFYVEQSYERMWQDFREDFGNVAVSVWVDEPSYRKATLPWTPGLPAAFEALWGYTFPMERLYCLFEEAEGAATLRYHYWRTVLRLLKDAYFTAVRDWCRANGMLFSGHLMAEDTMASQISATCFTMPLYQYFDMPGIDYLTAEMNWRYGEIKPENPGEADGWAYGRLITPLQCTSAAHQHGQERILAEMYGVSTQNLTPRDQKQMMDHFIALGINHRSVHGIFYSLAGRGKRAYPPHVNDYQPYWPKYRLLTDTLARESWFVRQGKPVRDVLLLHPMDSAFCEYSASGTHPALQRRDRAFLELTRALLGQQVNLEFGDEDTLADIGSIQADGRLAVGEMAYRTVVLPDMRNIRGTTLALLEAFLRADGHVLVLGEVPGLVDGIPSERAAAALRAATRVADLPALCDALSASPSLFRYRPRTDATRVLLHARRDGDDLLLFAANTDCREASEGELIVAGPFRAEQFRPEDGDILPLEARQAEGSTRIPIHLEAGGSLLLRLRPGEDVALPAAAPCRTICPLTPRWSLTRGGPNALVLEFCRFRQGDGPWQGPYPIVAVQELLTREAYRGEITLAYTFDTAIPLHSAQLALERPLEQAVALDGVAIPHEPVGHYLARAFETIPLPPMGAGRHELTMQRHFQPLGKARMAVTSLFENLGGVELEPMMLLGDFAVRSALEPGPQGCVRMHPHFTLGAESSACGGEIVREGYPFYAGTMTLETTFTLTARQAAAHPALTLDGLLASACEVFVGGESCGTLCWSPYRADLSGKAHAGENTLTLVLYNSLRNLLGPWHRPVGEIGACWAGYEHPDQPWTGVRKGEANPDWMAHRVPDQPGWTESYLLLPYGIVSPALTFDAAE